MNKYLILTFIILSFAAAQDQDPLEQDSVSLTYKIFNEKSNSGKKVHDSWFSSDKFMHFSLSAAIPGFSYYLYADRLNKKEEAGKIISVSLTALLGVGKELYDKKRRGHFSWKDLVWDGLGLAVGYLLFVHE